MAENNGNDVLLTITRELVDDIMIRTSLADHHRISIQLSVERHLTALADLAIAKQMVIEMLVEQHKADNERFNSIERNLAKFNKALNP